MLMSSFFIFNSKGVIDDPALSSLALVASLAVSSISLSASSIMQRSKPKFMWVLRDFVLALEGPDNSSPIPPSEYLENTLRGKPYKKTLLSIFSTLDCATLVTPVLEESKLHKLADLGWSALRAEFQTQIVSLRTKIFRDAKVKRSIMSDKDLSGMELLELLESIVLAINSNEVPKIDSLWMQIQKNDIQKHTSALLEEYDSLISLPCSEGDLEDQMESARKEVLRKFKGEDELARKDFLHAITVKNVNFYALNETKTAEKAEHTLKLLWKDEVVGKLVPGLSTTETVRERVEILQEKYFTRSVGNAKILRNVFDQNILPRVDKLLIEFATPREEVVHPSEESIRFQTKCFHRCVVM
jgi:hypothetical protein